VDWIKDGDAGTRFFHAKAKQRKLQLYVHCLKDEHNGQHYRFDAVSEILQDYYAALLGSTTAGSPPNKSMIDMGPRLSLAHQ